jgi:hypothetical protein
VQLKLCLFITLGVYLGFKYCRKNLAVLTHKIEYLITLPVKPELMSHQNYRQIYLTKFHPQIYRLVLYNKLNTIFSRFTVKPEVMSHRKYRQIVFDKISLSNIPSCII